MRAGLLTNVKQELTRSVITSRQVSLLHTLSTSDSVKLIR